METLPSRESNCLNLLMEYPFNQFFINFVCFIRDSLLFYFETYSEEHSVKLISNHKDLKTINDHFLDFDAKLEPKISILRDMCNTVSQKFNNFVRNIILK